MSSNCGVSKDGQQELNEEQDVSVSIEYLRTLLQSCDAAEQATAISTLSEFAQTDASMAEVMVELNVHCQLMRLLAPFKNANATEDTIQGEEESKHAVQSSSSSPCKLRPVLVNEILMTLLALCKDDRFFDLILPANFGRVINIITNEQYAKTCAVAVCTLLDVVGQMSSDLFDDIGDEIPLSLPAQSEPEWLHAYLSMMHTLTAHLDELEDAQYPHTVMASGLMDEIKLALSTASSSELAPIAKALMYGIVWNLCVAHRQPADKQKTKTAENGDQEATHAAQFDWMALYHAGCTDFMLESVSKQTYADMQLRIDAFAATMSSDIEQCSDIKKHTENDSNKRKPNEVGIVDFEHHQKWSEQLQRSIVDKIRAIRVLFELFENIFDSDDLMIAAAADPADDEEDAEDDEEAKRRNKCIFSVEFRNQLCGALVEGWLNMKKRELNVEKLSNVCGTVGLDYGSEVQSMVAELLHSFSNLLYTVMRESVVDLSTSRWQTLWNYCLERILADNSQSTQLMEQRQQAWKQVRILNGDAEAAEESKEAMNVEALAQAMAAGSVEAARDDAAVAYLCTMAIAKARDLSVTPTQVETVLRLFARIKTCHESRIEHDLKMFGTCVTDPDSSNQMQEYFPIDLVYVDDIDSYYMDLHRVLINLCTGADHDVDSCKRDTEQMRRILTALYDGVTVLAKNGDFIPRFVKQYRAAQNDEQKLATWEQECAQCHGMASLMLSFVTTQSILDVMCSSDACAKLPMNKKRLQEIAALYRKIQNEWKTFKICVDEWNTKVDTSKNNGKFDGVDWQCLDGEVSVPIKECLTNIEQFFRKIIAK